MYGAGQEVKTIFKIIKKSRSDNSARDFYILLRLCSLFGAAADAATFGASSAG